MGIERPVNSLMSKNLRIIIHCPSCPIAPEKVGGNQKTACLHLRKDGNRQERRSGKNLPIVKDKQCDWYEKDSIRKRSNNLNVITCTFS